MPPEHLEEGMIWTKESEKKELLERVILDK